MCELFNSTTYGISNAALTCWFENYISFYYWFHKTGNVGNQQNREHKSCRGKQFPTPFQTNMTDPWRPFGPHKLPQ